MHNLISAGEIVGPSIITLGIYQRIAKIDVVPRSPRMEVILAACPLVYDRKMMGIALLKIVRLYNYIESFGETHIESTRALLCLFYTQCCRLSDCLCRDNIAIVLTHRGSVSCLSVDPWIRIRGCHNQC